MSKVVVDTRAIEIHLRENLTSLDSYIASVNSNGESFKLHVTENRQDLKSIGECIDDLMTHMSKGCMATSDKEFASCIKTKKDGCDEGKEIS